MRDVSGEKRDRRGEWAKTSGSGRAPAILPRVSRGVVEAALPPPEPKSKIKLQRLNGKVYYGETVPSRITLSNKEKGDLGQELVKAYLQQEEGKAVRSLTLSPDQKAADLVSGSHVIEVKTGAAANGPTGRQWMAQPGTWRAEQERIAKMSPEARRKFNLRRRELTMQRKLKLVEKYSQKSGKKMSPKTIALILDAGHKKFDIFHIGGYHHQLGWNTDLAKKGYKGTYSYA